MFGLPVKDVFNYESGVKQIERGYATWFKISNQTYTLASEDKLGNAELQRKMLTRTFENLMTLKKTRPQHPAAL